jgi:hypothetical protein
MNDLMNNLITPPVRYGNFTQSVDELFKSRQAMSEVLKGTSKNLLDNIYQSDVFVEFCEGKPVNIPHSKNENEIASVIPQILTLGHIFKIKVEVDKKLSKTNQSVAFYEFNAARHGLKKISLLLHPGYEFLWEHFEKILSDTVILMLSKVDLELNRVKVWTDIARRVH